VATPAARGVRGDRGKTGMTRGVPFSQQNGTQSQRSRNAGVGLSTQLGSQDEGLKGDQLSVEELTKQVVQYVLVLHTKKVPMKKSEIVKNAMNFRTKDFGEVIIEVGHVLDDIFGCKLVAMKADEAGSMQVVPFREGSTFLVVNMFATSILESSGIRPIDSKNDGKRAIVRTILNCIYMLNRDIDDGTFCW